MSIGVFSEGSDEPAFPVEKWGNAQYPVYGLTKREYFACAILAGIWASPSVTDGPEEDAKTAIRYADALISKLKETE